jgi:hypothetical protein
MTTSIDQRPSADGHVIETEPGESICVVCHGKIARVHHASPWIHVEDACED